MKQLKIITTLAFLGLAISSCGSGGLSSKVEMDILPQSPLIVNADFTLGSGDEVTVVKAPWFENRYQFKNDSSQIMVVVTLKYTITGYKNGVAKETTVTLDPGLGCEDGYERPYLAYVLPGDSFVGLPVDAGGSFCWAEGVDFGTQSHSVKPDYERVYIDEIGESENNFYSVQVEALGWFEKVSSHEITERLTLTTSLTTR